MKKYFLIIVVIAFAFNACERNFNITGIDTLPPQPVVEGYIENGYPPYVFLTNTFSLYGSVSFSSLKNLFVHNATMSVTAKIINLKEYSIPFGKDTLYVYSVAGLDFTGSSGFQVPFAGFNVGVDVSKFNANDTGHLNTNYTLNITLKDGTKIDATTSILSPQILDSIWYINRSTDPKDTLVRVWVKQHDNGATKDFYRYFTKVNSGKFLPGNSQGLMSVYDDEFTNGQTYDVPVNPGIDRNDTTSAQFKHARYFVKGDTITLKQCKIDQGVFDFWQTADYAYANLGNPFSAPSNVKSNVHNALGVWCGYASNRPYKYQQIIIPK